jgi:hypothetical protein
LRRLFFGTDKAFVLEGGGSEVEDDGAFEACEREVIDDLGVFGGSNGSL